MSKLRKQFLSCITLCVMMRLCFAADERVFGGGPHGPVSLDCGQCHTTESWTKLRTDLQFKHDQTRFALTGRHTDVSCRQCHPSLVFSETGSECLDCHLDIHQGQFALACSQCHTPQGWNDESQMYRLHQQTRFPLTGVHASLDCQACHATGRYVALPLDCQGCHWGTYQKTRNPNHADAGFALDCSQCHSLTAANWSTSFQHTAAFPLTGGHGLENCSKCHTGPYAETSGECISCHRIRYEAATNPNHVTGQFPEECAECHTINGWRPAQFDHNLSQFPLTGAHIQTDCRLCHLNGQFTGTSSLCYDCHRPDFEAAQDPNHAAEQFPQSCEQCHSTDAWQPSTFHHDDTQFPLTGAHATVDCRLCHVSGQFAGTTTECYGCHRGDFEGVQNPNHVAGQYPQTCVLCHNTVAWLPTFFEHNQTNFPLTGAHVSSNCLQCHVNGQYAGTPTDCYFCHEADYNNAQDPNHAAAGFPQECSLCHTTFNWNAQFDHDGLYFPIYSGRHRNDWDRCSDCHTDANNYTVFSCIICHEHNCADMADAHNEVPNFVCESSACYACHPDGDADARLRHRLPNRPTPTPRIK